MSLLLTTLLMASSPVAKEPEVIFRHCMRDQVLALGRSAKPTYQQASAFARNCDASVRRAAVLVTRRDLGRQFDERNPATVAYYQKMKAEIIHAHVCAYAFDPHFCQPVY